MLLYICLIVTSLLYQKAYSKLPQDCIKKHDSGSCDEAVIKFFFNSTTGKCNEFIYGGCEGNNNRFDTVQECVEACGKKENAVTTFGNCLLEKDPGPCSGKLESYFYESTTGECSAFQYGGCLGNANEFKSKKECLNYCGPRYGGKCSEEKSASKVCQIYVQCVNGTGFTKLCENGLAFNPTTRKCEASSGISVCKEKAQTNPCADQPDGIYPSQECNAYIQCWNKQTKWHICPFASVYSNVTKSCNYLKYSPGCSDYYPDAYIPDYRGASDPQ